MAFLNMDLALRGRRDLCRVLTNIYFDATGDQEGRDLLSFYTAYRATVRGKVEGMKLAEDEIPPADRDAAAARSRANWLLALSELEKSASKPCLVLVGGLPGTGKSTLARRLAEEANSCVIRSDVVRKELAGKAANESAEASYRQGIYSEAWTDRTYAECLQRAEMLLFEGHRLVVDATFASDGKRLDFLNLGARLAVPVVLFICQADRELVYSRLRSRVGDPPMRRLRSTRKHQAIGKTQGPRCGPSCTKFLPTAFHTNRSQTRWNAYERCSCMPNGLPEGGLR